MYLSNLTPEELYVLLSNLRNIFAYYDEEKYLVPDEALTQFLQHCSQTIGDSYFKTPRNTIKAFVDFLSILEENPNIQWTDLLTKIKISFDNSDTNELASELNDNSNEDNEELASFTL